MRSGLFLRVQQPLVVYLFLLLTITSCSGGSADSGSPTARAGENGKHAFDPPEVTSGERLFLETRFAQFFKAYLDSGGKVNDALPASDPVVDQAQTTGLPLPGPFAGLSMNCRSCHFVDEFVGVPGGACVPTPTSPAAALFRPARMENK
jgi:hypothetical protein